jgi:hypothetical protein
VREIARHSASRRTQWHGGADKNRKGRTTSMEIGTVHITTEEEHNRESCVIEWAVSALVLWVRSPTERMRSWSLCD